MDATPGVLKDIKRQRGKIESTCSKKNVISFFDEAQNLSPAGSSALYHTVLWLQRQDRNEHYVGVWLGHSLDKCHVVDPGIGFHGMLNRETRTKIRRKQHQTLS